MADRALQERPVTWQQVLIHLAYGLETNFDTLKYRLAERLDAAKPLKIVPYRGQRHAGQVVPEGARAGGQARRIRRGQ
jgi:hypothetical protein